MRSRINVHHTMLGAGVELVAWVGGVLMPMTLPIMIFVGLVGLCLIYIGISPWLKQHVENIPIPNNVPQNWKNIWVWYIYKPLIGVGDIIQTSKGIHDKVFQFSIFLDINVTTLFPYGETEVNFSCANLVIHQQRNTFLFKFRGEQAAKMIGGPESHNFFEAFLLVQNKNSHTLFDEDGEFRWALKNVVASLRGDYAYVATGMVPKIRGRKRGKKRQADEA